MFYLNFITSFSLLLHSKLRFYLILQSIKTLILSDLFMSFLQRVIFQTTLFYGKTLAQLGYRDWYTRIDERVILGIL